MFALLLLACLEPYQEAEVPTPVAEEIGPEGGIISVGALSLEIPEGALDEAVEIRIYDTTESPPDPYIGFSTVWAFEPDGLQFALPFTVSIPFDGDAEGARLYWSNDEGGYDALSATLDGTALTGQTDHFSSGFVGMPPFEEELFDNPVPPADVLFIVDNSCSMAEEQTALADAFTGVLDAGITSFDFHLGVVSTDMDATDHRGRLREVGTARWVDGNTADPQSVFAQMAIMGIDGSPDEQGREGAYRALEVRAAGYNAGFLREGSTISMVFVSDEPDFSGADTISRAGFIDWMATKRAHPTDVIAHVIVGLNNSCAELGQQYIDYADATGGGLGDICAANYGPALQPVVDFLDASGRVTLAGTPDPADLEVSVDLGNGFVDLDPADYRFDAASNTVFFDQGWAVAPTSQVRVRW